MSAPSLKLEQIPGVLYSLLNPAERRRLAKVIVWDEDHRPYPLTRTDIERRLVGLFEQIAAELELHS